MSEQQPDAAATDPATDSDTSSDADSSSEDTTSDSTESLDSGGPGDIGDDQLPPDLQPTEENPLARHPDQTGDEDDAIGTDREEAPETAPLTAADADYGGAGSSSSGGDSSGDSSGGSGNDSGGSTTDDGRVNAEEDDGSASLDNGGGGAG
jgi:hypothetical protein